MASTKLYNALITIPITAGYENFSSKILKLSFNMCFLSSSMLLNNKKLIKILANDKPFLILNKVSRIIYNFFNHLILYFLIQKPNNILV
jgi:hypothetical protein